MKVYLSYALADRRWAHQLGSRLEAAGLDVWDPEREIMPGDNWGAKLGKALDRSDAMVVLISPDSIESRAVRNEIEFALGSARFSGRLIPVIVKPTRKIPWILKELPLVHLKESGPAEVAEQIAGMLKKGQAVAAAGA